MIQISAAEYKTGAEVIAAARNRKRRVEDDSFFAQKYRAEKAKTEDLQKRLAYVERRLSNAEATAVEASRRANFFETQNLMLHEDIKKLVSMPGKPSAKAAMERPALGTIEADGKNGIAHPVRDYITKRAREMGFRYVDIVGQTRKSDITSARQLIMWEVKKEFRPSISFPELGRLFGGRDHSTCCHSIRKIQALKDAGAIE